MKKYIILLVFLFSIQVSSQVVKPDINLLMKHVNFFTDSKQNGRLSGTNGFDNSIEYCMDYFKSIGVEPVSTEFWPQRFPIDVNVINEALMYIEYEENNVELKVGTDFSVRGYSGSGNINEDVIFCGYGFENDLYSDYASVDVKEKIVMVFKSNPPFIKDLPRMSIRTKADLAYQKGARAIIFVSQPNQKNPQKPIGSVMHGEGPMHTDMPQVQVTIEVANRLMKNSEYSLSEAQTLLDSLAQPLSFNCNTQAIIKIDADYNEDGSSSNIAGIIRGKDPVLAEEYIMITAHLDHVGAIGNKVYYPGANDNASGSAAVLEIARFISNEVDYIKRSVIFVLFGSEEKGLIGSQFMADNLPVPKEQIVAVFNMDCIAYGDSIMVGNGKSSPILWNIAKELNDKHVNKMVERTWAGGGADLTPFHNKGINGLYFVTTNSYEFLHLPGDKPETLNKDLYKDLVKLLALLTYELAIKGCSLEE